MLDVIRKLDAFSKAQDDFKVQTNSGAVGNFFSIKNIYKNILIILLF